MRYCLALLLIVSWSLWLGGQAALVLLIMALFIQDRPTAVRAGPVMFPVFERYQLVLAALAFVAAAGLYMVTRRKILLVTLACFVLAAGGAMISRCCVTPKMVELWREDRSSGPEFVALHRQSRTLYNSEFVLLLIAGAVMPAAIRDALQRGGSDPRATEPRA